MENSNLEVCTNLNSMEKPRVYTNLNSMESLKHLTEFMNINIWECDNKEYNAPHSFNITEPVDNNLIHTIQFQKGPIKEVGINGLSIESLLLISSRVLESFQNSEFKNEYNEKALEHILIALDSLNQRTRDRLERNVEGTNKE